MIAMMIMSGVKWPNDRYADHYPVVCSVVMLGDQKKGSLVKETKEEEGVLYYIAFLWRGILD